ncbi:hypothetical protein [Brevundimonas sp.]|uniref:hypothetical protein n=1 Tax=Brevundimonas sp. TaxID=1871086 RepID=UPI002FCBB4E1
MTRRLMVLLLLLAGCAPTAIATGVAAPRLIDGNGREVAFSGALPEGFALSRGVLGPDFVTYEIASGGVVYVQTYSGNFADFPKRDAGPGRVRGRNPKTYEIRENGRERPMEYLWTDDNRDFPGYLQITIPAGLTGEQRATARSIAGSLRPAPFS